MTEIPSVDGLDNAVDKMKGKVDCLMMVSDPSLYSPRLLPQFLLKTLQNGLPVIGVAAPAYAKAGALVAVYWDVEESGRLAAQAGVRILGGEEAGSIPYLWPSKVKSTVNLVVAQRLGIKVSPAVLQQAEEVIR